MMPLLMSRLPNKFPKSVWTHGKISEPCCLHDSTLSFASHALFAAQNGLQEAAEKYFKKALYLDLHEIMNNTGKEGLILPAWAKRGRAFSAWSDSGWRYSSFLPCIAIRVEGAEDEFLLAGKVLSAYGL